MAINTLFYHTWTTVIIIKTVSFAIWNILLNPCWVRTIAFKINWCLLLWYVRTFVMSPYAPLTGSFTIRTGVCKARPVHLSRLGKRYLAPQPGDYSLRWTIRGGSSPKGSFSKVYYRPGISWIVVKKKEGETAIWICKGYFKMQRIIAPNGRLI